MQIQREGIMTIERKYIDVPLSSITAPHVQTAAMGGRSSQPVHELGLRLLELSRKGDAEGVRDLMNRGAPFSTDWLGTSPLHFAAQNNHSETVEILLKAGISRDARNKVERTPLHVAAQEGHFEILKMLILYGADVDCQDLLRMTPLHWASEKGELECVKVLIENGADPDMQNKFDKTPALIAQDNGYINIVIMLHEASMIHPAARKALKNQQLEMMDLLKEAEGDTNVDMATVPVISCDNDTFSVDGTQLPVNGLSQKNPKISGKKRMNNSRILQQPIKSVCINNVQFARYNGADDEVDLSSFSRETRSESEDSETARCTLRLLQEHGIAMLPVDETPMVTSAVQSGQTVVLTEAGKMALNLSKLNDNLTGVSEEAKSGESKIIKASPKKILINGSKLIRVQPQDLINMAKDRKVIFHTGDKSLGRPAQVVFKQRINNNILTKPSDIQNKTITSSEIQNKLSASECVINGDELKNVSELTRQLEVAKREANMYKQRYLLTERRFKEYKLKHRCGSSCSSDNN